MENKLDRGQLDLCDYVVVLLREGRGFVYFFEILKTGCASGAYVTQKNLIDLCDYVLKNQLNNKLK